jgi:hypothetical protein
LKLLRRRQQIPSRNFKWKSGIGIISLAGARDFPKFVKAVRPETEHELRKVGHLSMIRKSGNRFSEKIMLK